MEINVLYVAEVDGARHFFATTYARNAFLNKVYWENTRAVVREYEINLG